MMGIEKKMIKAVLASITWGLISSRADDVRGFSDDLLDSWEKEEEGEKSSQLFNFRHNNVKDSSYNYSYDTGWSATGRSFRFEERLANGDVRGSFGWVDKPGGLVRVTKYTADRRGYRTRQFSRRLEKKRKRKQEQELLIVGPIPPFLRESHLAANPGAVVGEEAYTEYAKDEDDSEQILTFSEIPNEEYPLYPAG